MRCAQTRTLPWVTPPGLLPIEKRLAAWVIQDDRRKTRSNENELTTLLPMTDTIFCPSNHLLLDAPRCEICGWVRPLPGSLGTIAWEVPSVGGPLGGTGARVHLEIENGVLLLPLGTGALTAWDLRRQARIWQKNLDPGIRSYGCVADGRRWLTALCDERSIEEAHGGSLVAVAPATGEIRPIWQAGAHKLSLPVPAEHEWIVRTADYELVAFDRATDEIVWRRPLAYGQGLVQALPGRTLLFCDGHIIQGDWTLSALDLDTQNLLWQQPVSSILVHAGLALGDVWVYREEKKLAARNLKTGAVVWEKDCSHLYGGLASDGNSVFVALRGNRDRQAPDHYLLQALDPQTGSEIWRMGLPDRVNQMVYLAPGSLILTGDHGGLMAFSTRDGSRLWSCEATIREDPFGTDLICENGLALIGTRSGRFAAVHVGIPQKTAGDPRELLAGGKLQAAADGFALAGNLEQAGDIYADGLNEPLKALQLYERGGRHRKAADLAFRLGRYTQALDAFTALNDLDGQVNALLALGDELKAAPILESMGRLDKAAWAYEKGGDPYNAWKIHLRLQHPEEVHRLTALLPDNAYVIDALDAAGLVREAAEKALLAGLLEKAAKLFHKAGQAQQELGTLKRLVEIHPEDWSLLRISELARSQGAFEDQANALAALHRNDEAALAYQNAAEQSEVLDAGNEARVAGLYEQAAKYYRYCGLDEEYKHCHYKVIHYRRLPWVVVNGTAPKAFIEGEFNSLVLQVKNIGRGAAHDVAIRANEDRFELDPDATRILMEKDLRSLYYSRTKEVTISLRPLKGQVGDNVTLILEWTWKDDAGNVYSDSAQTIIKVKRQGDSSGSTPVQNIYNVSAGGKVIQADGDVQVIDGDYAAGDKIGGDKVMAGANKGDQVNINRPHGFQIHSDEPASNDGEPEPCGEPCIPCPVCHLPVRVGDHFCDKCGHDMTTSAPVGG
jgi:outer membrane protein assembly factor BamB